MALVSLASLPAIGVALYEGGSLVYGLASIFVLAILVHYVRLARRRAPLANVVYSGGCLLPILVWVGVGFTYFVNCPDLGPYLGMMCMLNALFIPVGAVAACLTAVLIEAARSAWAGFWIARRRQRRRMQRTSRAHGEAEDERLPLEMPLSNFLPRRFGVRGMMVLMTLASMLMALLQVLHVPAEWSLAVLIFVSGVLAGQVLLFRGRKPLAASAWVGGLLLPCDAMIVIEGHLLRNDLSHLSGVIGDVLPGVALYMVPSGIVLGAAVGVLARRTYTLSESIYRRLFHRPPQIELLPFTADDFPVLLAWVRSPALLRRWAGGEFAFPLDRDQLQRRLAATAGDRPPSLMFKAVSSACGEMLAYAELGRLDRPISAARLELPLVAPDAADRDLLGILFFRAIAEKAFRELGFQQLHVPFDDPQGELATCCRRAWKRKYDYVDITVRDDSGIRYLGLLEPRR